MSDSKNRPPDDEWIKSLYASEKDSDEAIPESIDAAILAKAHQPQQNIQSSGFQRNRWIYGTAASALLGILLILQIPESEVLPSLLEKVEERQVQISKPVAISEKLLKQAPAKARGFLIPPTQTEPFSTLMDRELSRCIKLNAYLTNTDEIQVIEQCETDTQLSFQFKQESTDACNEIFQFALKSTATVSIRNRDSESGMEEIQIDHADKLYSLRCDAGQWVLTPGVNEQP